MATFRGIVVASAVLVVFAVGAFTAFQVADVGQNNAPDEPATAVNESIVVEYDSYQYVDNATDEFTTGFNNTTTVYNTNGTELDRGTDYEWNNSDGTILFLNTSATTEGDSANITYDYFTNTETVRDTSGPLTAVVEAVGWVGVAGTGFALVVLLLWFGWFIVSKIGNSGAPRSRR